MVPKSQDELANKMGDNLNKYWLPQISLPIGQKKGTGGSTSSKVLPIKLMVQETSQGVGMAVFPVVDVTSSTARLGEEHVPGGEDYKQTTIRFMRDVKLPANKTSKTVDRELQKASKGEADKACDSYVPVWPQYRAPADQTFLGMFIFLISFLVHLFVAKRF